MCPQNIGLYIRTTLGQHNSAEDQFCAVGLLVPYVAHRRSHDFVWGVHFFFLPKKLTTVFSERELKFMFAICHRRSVCLSSVCRLSSVTFVHPTQAIEIFGNISTPCGTLAIPDICVKILRRSSQGNLSVGGVKHKRGSRI